MIDSNKAKTIASEAWKLCESEDWEAAILKYEESTSFLDPDHWHSQDIYGEYAMALGKVGKQDQAEIPLRKALGSAIRTSGNEALGTTIARYFLAQNLAHRKKIEEANEVISHWLNQDIDGKWLLNYMGAVLAAMQGNVGTMKEMATNAFNQAPNGKWTSVEEVVEYIENELCS